MTSITLNSCDEAFIYLDDRNYKIEIGENEEIDIEVNGLYENNGEVYEVMEICYGEDGEILIDTIPAEVKKLTVV